MPKTDYEILQEEYDNFKKLKQQEMEKIIKEKQDLENLNKKMTEIAEQRKTLLNNTEKNLEIEKEVNKKWNEQWNKRNEAVKETAKKENSYDELLKKLKI